MRDNIELQIKSIENKIERLNIQKDFYLLILQRKDHSPSKEREKE